MVADPCDTPVTTPWLLTMATGLLFEDHATGRPVRTLPEESRALAMSCAVAPTATDADEGLTATVATGAGCVGGVEVTVSTDVSARPLLAAMMRVVPAATPRASPEGETVATPLLVVDHVIVAFIVFPDPSRAWAANCRVAPAARLAVAGVRLTDASVGGGGEICAPTRTGIVSARPALDLIARFRRQLDISAPRNRRAVRCDGDGWARGTCCREDGLTRFGNLVEGGARGFILARAGRDGGTERGSLEERQSSGQLVPERHTPSG
jgi:hypothetical protein